VPHLVRPGDRLVALLAGSDLTPVQAAALNCLDDPSALPVGAVIWLPRPDMPVQTPTAGDDAPAIFLFTAADTTPLNVEGTTLRWRARGSAVYLYPCPAEGDECPRPLDVVALPLVGELNVRDFQQAGTVRYQLEVVGGDSPPVTRQIALEVACSHQSLAPDTRRCPAAPPLATFAVSQPFEGGVMLYFGDTGEIYVLTRADQRVRVFRDTFEEWMPSVEYPNIPDERFPAIRGFGIVWNQLGGPDSPLGWATAPEGGIDAARQAAGRLSYTTYISGVGAVYAVTFAPGEPLGWWGQVR
jgi:hypothetical protein